MTVVRRRLFWKIYLTLLASLVAAIVFMGAFVWFVGEAQREAAPDDAPRHAWFGPSDVSLYASDGKLVGARGTRLSMADHEAGRHWGPGHVMRLDLPGGGFVLTRFGPPKRTRAIRLAMAMMAVLGGVGLAAYPVTTLLTRRLERLRAGVARWGEDIEPLRLDDRGHDEVALLARTFNDAATRLSALLASQKALLANASHELRSPLARLRMAIEMDAPERETPSHTEIVRNLAEMDELVDELLLSSRLDHPESRKDRHEIVDLLGLAAEEAARCDATVTGEPVEVEGDPVLLRRMMRNLLENGAKHGKPPITITVKHADRGAVLTVEDAGPGIAPGDRVRIFEPFYRPAGASEGSGGWGLGLALVRQIAEHHGGTVECQATPTSGSHFVVRLAR